MAAATFEIDVGIVWRRTIRNLVDEARFQGHDVQLHESRYFLGSHFIIKGDAEILRRIHAVLQKAAQST